MEDRTVPTGEVTEFSAGITAASQPIGIAAGPDGNLWFTEADPNNGSRIGRITPQGTVTEFSAGITPGSEPIGITAGPDGNLWFTEQVGNRIGRITPQGTVNEFSAGIAPGSKPLGITAGPDGNLWFTESGANRIGRITPQGAVTEFRTSFTAGMYPSEIAAGPDGSLWFTENSNINGTGIGRMTPQGSVTAEFSAGITAGKQLVGIAAGPDGNLWFTEYGQVLSGSNIGRITPQGTVTEFSAGATSGPLGIAAGPDGNLWFTEIESNRIGRITPQGSVTQFGSGISPGSGLGLIAAGSDGNLWFTETMGNGIGRIESKLVSSVKLNGSSSASYGQTSVLTATVTPTGPSVEPLPSGLVNFYDGSTLLGAGTLNGGVAVLNASSLAVESHNLTAAYTGDVNYGISTSPVFIEQVNPAATAVSLSASTTSSTAGNFVTLAATVTNTGSPATPLGYVTFFDGGTPVGVATLSGGIAAVGVSPTAAGTNHLSATFTPAPGFQASQTAGSTDLAVIPAAATELAFTGQPRFALSGKYIQGSVQVAVEDRYGNVVTGSAAAITVSLAGPGKSVLAGTRTQAATNGVATFPNLKVTGHGPGFSLTAASSGLASATSLPFDVSDAVRFKVQVSAPVVAGQPFTVVVTAVDALGRVDPYYLGSVNLTGTGLTGQTAGTFAPTDKGKKAFTLKLPTAGKVVLTVTDTLSAGVVGKLTVTVKA
jgi:streptogramin lyase